MSPVTLALSLVLAALSGASIALQAGVNAQLGRYLGHPLWASLVSFSIGTLFLLPLLAIFRAPEPAFSVALKGQWWVWTGGIIGAFFVTMALMLAPKVGVAAFLAAMIMGQLISALIIDHFGLVGLPVRLITWPRALGTALVVLGVLVMQIRVGS